MFLIKTKYQLIGSILIIKILTISILNEYNK
ncbi:hypothetical protein BJV85_001373 [Clostridium acetobutylicum]|nr:hypothetical protein [Clostridium acetobutylicum]NOW13249.1 hypothetical protein [Clostridium acetobutylicum]NRY55626.1 hypothetical protein [Clostridium acetobutylicum]NSA92527.1 hypothetical protein [Clostridium acetobutylicum]NYC93536.1 hypothetical protein [Clostridium acetobutylicum]